MTCEQARELMGDALAGRLASEEELTYRRHLTACAMCRDESSEAARMWTLLGAVPDEEPTPALRENFLRLIEAYQQGKSARTERHWFGWLRQPVWQAAFALSLLAVGLAGGYSMGRPRSEPADVAQLKSEMNQMRQLVTLSLLQQQSASDRLQGVNWSYRVAQSDTEVLSALLTAVNTDTNVNVRLAAVDALRSFRASPVARRGATLSLAKQSSPLVQIAILDLLVELGERPAAGAIRQLTAQSALDENVLRRAQSAVRELE